MATDLNLLLAELEGMTDGERTWHMVEYGRRSTSDPRMAAVIEQLAKGTFAERRLALIASHGTRDGAQVLRAMTDPSVWIRGSAIRSVALLCDDDQALAALASLPRRRRRRLAVRLARRRRQDVVDRLLTGGGLSPRERRELLPFATGAVVSSRLDWMDDGSDRDWKRLAGQHPVVVGQALLERVRSAEEPDARLVWLANAVTAVLAKRRSTAALELQQALAAVVSPSRLALDRLLPWHATAVADVVLASHDEVRLRLGPALDRLDGRRLATLAYRLPGARAEITSRFRHLSPEAREAVYRTVGATWRDARGILHIDIVRWLADPARGEEAHRHLRLPALVTQPARRLPYVSLLGWDQALPELSAELGSPDPDLRGLALAALVGSVRYQRERAAELVDFLRRRQYEQDPVRAAFLRSLAGLPPGTWHEAHLPGLGDVIRHALDAGDLSQGSAVSITELAVSLVQRHPDWAAQALTDIARERGHLHSPDLGARMSDRHLAHLVPRLLPVLEAWNARSREHPLVEVVDSLGPRLRASPELGELLERVLLTTRSGAVAVRCLALLRRHQPDRFADAAGRLLSRDRSAILLGDVASLVSRRRQDLLSPFLEVRAYSGRFSISKSPVVLSFADGFQRWTGAQQAAFARAHGRLTRRDATRDTPTILRALHQLADLHLEPPARLMEMATAEHPALRDAALQLLGRVDRPDMALPVLLTALADDRARVALYALRRTILSMPPAEAITHLSRAPVDKVTVAKEVVRLLGELPVPEALDRLAGINATELHRDVRTALLRALWGHLDRQKAWEILEAAAASSDPAIVRPLVRIPPQDLDRDGQRRLVALLARLASHPDPAVRLEVATRWPRLPLPDPDGRLVAALISQLASRLPDERSAAGDAVFAVAHARDAGRVGESIRSLLPHRRALSSAVGALVGALPLARHRLLPVAREVLAELDRDPMAAPLALAVAARALDWSELGERLAGWSAQGHLDGDLFVEAVRTLGSAADLGHGPEFDELSALETRLSAASAPRLRRLGLAALVGLAATPGGWSPERLARLHAYRDDPSPLVAGPAQFTFPPEEDSSA